MHLPTQGGDGETRIIPAVAGVNCPEPRPMRFHGLLIVIGWSRWGLPGAGWTRRWLLALAVRHRGGWALPGTGWRWRGSTAGEWFAHAALWRACRGWLLRLLRLRLQARPWTHSSAGKRCR